MLNINDLKEVSNSTKFEVLYHNQKLKAYKEGEKCLFIIAKGYHNKGYREYWDANGNIKNIELVKIVTKADENIQWKKRLKRAIDCLSNSGLWENIKEVFQNLYNSNITLFEKRDISSMDDEEQVSYCKEKGYNFMIVKNREDKEVVNTDYLYELSGCQLKSMYFGKYENTEIKERIEQALLNKKDYSVQRTVNYDNSFSYVAEKNMAWYSEEYRGCGNGHYYLALDNSTAVFCEND